MSRAAAGGLLLAFVVVQVAACGAEGYFACVVLEIIATDLKQIFLPVFSSGVAALLAIPLSLALNPRRAGRLRRLGSAFALLHAAFLLAFILLFVWVCNLPHGPGPFQDLH